MRIVDLLNKDSILLNGAPKSKTEAIDMLVDLQMKSGNISDREIYKQGILAREEKGSTAVGEGIAIPHAKSSAVKAPSLAAMTVPGGVDYEALDDEPSDVLFMIAAPDTEADVHLEVLSRLMTLLMDEDFRAKLLSAKDTDEFLSVIDTAEKAKYPDEPTAKEVPENTDRIKVLAVTACPTGIAHTYMAAEALEKTGKKLPWGYLTGVRPSKIAYTMLEEGATKEQIKKHFMDKHYASEDKAELALTVARKELDILTDMDYKTGYSLYIGIPFCPSICLYCSFSSYALGAYKDYVDNYVDALIKEIRFVAESMKGRRLDTVYMAG